MKTAGIALACWLSGLGDYEVQPLKEAAPAALNEAVCAELAAEGVRILGAEGNPFADLWLRKSVPVQQAKEEPAIKFTALKPGTLVGAVRFHGEGSDFRAQKVAPGVYTLRYAVQPQDGDHQGTSDTRDFLALLPAADDSTPEPMEPKSAIEHSTKVSGKKHPAILYLAKVRAESGFPRLVQDKANERWVLQGEIPAAVDGAKPVRLGIVVVGKASDF
jgi:hypothetical protein